eukprot:m.17070 g.17070  ORF g.17070 m.17070 type:complete len:203 (+) comp10642_c0_seq1:54-662(+)
MYKLIVVLAIASSAIAASGPPFCKGNECPAFKVLNSTNSYETRLYNQSMWARTIVNGLDFDKAQSESFSRLFSYISGANEQKKTIEMTTPVPARVNRVGGTPFSNNTFEIGFMVPFEFQNNPPKPSAANVYIAIEPEHVAFVAAFGGFADQSKYTAASVELAKVLDATGVPYQQDFMIAAGYDSPYTILNRHNEVHFYAPSQ